MRRALAALAISLGLTALLSPAAGATDPAMRPLNPEVGGGPMIWPLWHADNTFRIDWDLPSDAGGEIEVAAVHLRLRDGGGRVVAPDQRLPGTTNPIADIRVPATPGRYEAEVWLEAGDGETGPAVRLGLHFDNLRPPPTRALVADDWIAGDEVVRVQLEHPSGPQPVSGIAGYAVSVGPGAGIVPCAGPDRCRPEEVDVAAASGYATISLGLLPEGAHVVRAVAVSGSGMRSTEARAVVRVDATAPVVAIDAPGGWVDHPVLASARAVDQLAGMGASGPSGAYTAISVDGGASRLEPGPSVSAAVSGQGVHTVAASARDAAGNIGVAIETAQVRIDESAPALAFARAQDPADPERIEATALDGLSGVDPASGSIELRPAGSRQRFQALPTSVAKGRLVAHWDSNAFADGSYEFRAIAADLAGNVGATERRGDGARMVLANPLKAATLLEARLGGGVAAVAQTVDFGREAVYRGRLSSISGAPLGGQTVEVVETFAAGSRPARRSTPLRTEADGGFSIRLAAGPSRRVEVAFGGSRTLGRSRGGEAQVIVRSGVRLRASSALARIGGRAVVFRGRLADLGTRIAPGGRPVELQFEVPGGSWSEFRTVRTDAHGRFRYPYSFSDDDSRGVRFRFRAYVPAEPGWPYEPAASRPVFVTGR
jgi:hypothetical protein